MLIDYMFTHLEANYQSVRVHRSVADQGLQRAGVRDSAAYNAGTGPSMGQSRANTHPLTWRAQHCDCGRLMIHWQKSSCVVFIHH